jgi:hypothetical protein
VGKDFSPLHVVQSGSGAHSASYTMGTGGSFLRGKAAKKALQHVPSKRLLIFNVIHGATSQKTELSIKTAVRTSNPKYLKYSCIHTHFNKYGCMQVLSPSVTTTDETFANLLVSVWKHSKPSLIRTNLGERSSGLSDNPIL